MSLFYENDLSRLTLVGYRKIPNIRVKLGGIDLSLPVALFRDKTGDFKARLDTRGRYIYALPGGRMINKDGDILKAGAL